jgi:hypothetical protein
MGLPRSVIAGLASLACFAALPASSTVAHDFDRGIVADASGAAATSDGPVLLGTTGDVRIAIPGGSAAAKAGDVLPSTSEIETGPLGTARLGFAGGAKLEIEQSTRAALENPATLRLSSGTVRLNSAVPHGTMAIRTPQALVVFRAQTGYVTASAAEDVVTCVHCERHERIKCEDDDFFVRDMARCVALANAAVAIVTRQHGIRASAAGEEAMVHRVLQQLGARIAAAPAGRPWWDAAPGEGITMDHARIFAKAGEAVALSVTRKAEDAGNVWAMSVDSSVATVEAADPRGTCTIRVHDRGRGAVVVYDQLGRYTVVPVEVSRIAAR